MKTKENYKSIERLHVPHWLTDRVQLANFEFVEHMEWMLLRNRYFNEVLQIERKEIAHLQQNRNSLRNLLRTPFLMVAPTLPTIEDWRCLIEDMPTTLTIDQLRRKMPVLEPIEELVAQQVNKQYMELVISVVHMSVLCAPLLGISTELAQYLASVPAYRLHTALARLKGIPLFRWRFHGTTFWYEFTAETLTDELVAHQIMLTSPTRAAEMSAGTGWSDLRLDRAHNQLYAAALIAHGCRASTASNLFNLNQNTMRALYLQIHGESSKCGNNPNSLQWFVKNPQHRLHSSTFVWLYRSAIAMGANTPEALIATYDIYSKLFGGAQLISVDRGFNLTRLMAADTRLAVAPCRTCSTHYVVSNNDSKIEMRSSFECPACTLQLGGRRKTRGQSQPK